MFFPVLFCILSCLHRSMFYSGSPGCPPPHILFGRVDHPPSRCFRPNSLSSTLFVPFFLVLSFETRQHFPPFGAGRLPLEPCSRLSLKGTCFFPTAGTSIPFFEYYTLLPPLAYLFFFRCSHVFLFSFFFSFFQLLFRDNGDDCFFFLVFFASPRR